VALAREQLRLDPNDAEALSFVATGLARTGHTAEADAQIRKALAIDDKDPSVLADAAIVAALDKRAPDALAWLHKAVAAGYCPAILARQPEFASLRDNPEFRSIIAAPRSAAGS
jgi:Flp pilus assembly protein TadD